MGDSSTQYATASPLLGETQFNTDEMPWAPFPGIKGGGFKLLRVHPDTGGYTALLWIPPGTRGPLHKHTAAVEYLILQGHVDFGDRVLGPGSYFYEPSGLTHSEPAPDEDVVMLVMSFGPIATYRPDGAPGPVVDADLLAGFYDRAVQNGGVPDGPSLRSGA